MKILLVSPKCPETFWSFKYALKFIVIQKAPNPPLGLLTVASMIPKKWEKKLVDMNVMSLNDKDLKWADFVFVSAMSIQKESVKEIMVRAQKMGVKIVAGGPLFTSSYDEFEEVDHLVLNEAEITLPSFLENLGDGCPKHIYTSNQWADIRKTPIPLWELVNMKKYTSMSIQYSRGCPFDCEFCDVTLLYGHRPRTKDKDQVIAELESLYSQGWKWKVFFVDDNFIGNKEKLKKEVLPAIAKWMEKRRRPFSFFTQASIDLSDDEELMRLMVQAGFYSVFVGIETPNEKSLSECNKSLNMNRDLIACVRKMQKFGLEVDGGFIVGFDSDPPSIFERQIKFIQKSEIVTAMVGLLNAPRDTRLYQRLKKENRLLKDSLGDIGSVNFVPKMSYETLIDGYEKIVKTIYSPPYYYERVRRFLKNYKLPPKGGRFRFSDLVGFFMSILVLGIVEKGRFYYWRLFFKIMFTRPRFFPLAITYTTYGFHFRKFFEKCRRNSQKENT